MNGKGENRTINKEKGDDFSLVGFFKNDYLITGTITGNFNGLKNVNIELKDSVGWGTFEGVNFKCTEGSF